MIVFNKKRIIFLISTLMISFISIGFTKDFKDLNVVQTSSTPASGYTVILDAGHRPTRWRSSK